MKYMSPLKKEAADMEINARICSEDEIFEPREKRKTGRAEAQRGR